MIRIDLDMDMPEECHECPFQLKFKDDEVDPWYMRRCVIMQRNIEYPRPEWCPLKEQPDIVRCRDCKYCEYPQSEKEWCKKGHLHGNAENWFCADGERKDDG